VEWKLTDLYDDVHVREHEDRWLLTYNVPSELEHDGVYSVSMPKNMINDFASTYGYDLDDEQDVKDMFEHLFNLPFVREIARREGRNAEASANPYEMPVETAKRLAKTQVQEFKQNGHRLVAVAEKVAKRGAGGLVTDGDILGFLRRDMLSRASKNAVNELIARKAKIRNETQSAMRDMALRMNASRP
jgi:hypothetical protein